MQPLFRLPVRAVRRRESLARRRTARQLFLIKTGYHPLSPTVPGRVLHLHPDAVRNATDRTTGPRCAGCAFAHKLDESHGGDESNLRSAGTPGAAWGKEQYRCWFNKGERVTRGAATRLRLWWPACVDYVADPVSSD